MNKTLLSAAVAVGFVVGVAGAPPSAFAGSRSYSSTSVGYHWSHHDRYRGWGDDRRWSHHGGRYYGHYRYHDHHGTGEVLLGAMLGLLAFGAISSASDHNDGPSYSYAGPPPVSYAPPGDGCHTVNRIGPDRSGQTVKFAATMCYDQSGTPFIAPGSQHIIERY